ncbi:PREDICTED: R3H domain-containing protein 4-like [Amphimedon queenslandica]|uniref:R3H-associated N-terminal domain-containing protein n=1 Tax=Amphimedon queenslandica TaxID=400682 RepID=A0A1X7U4B9_AMPQE|nr:PREDICTED: R3H domain-containing protein 4-like [Amphimedon queenslandica]|eukprot:XP_003389044.1 PREDICTED: R3H domain-containing protein 4-like [Amphimedon queenslandica]
MPLVRPSSSYSSTRDNRDGYQSNESADDEIEDLQIPLVPAESHSSSTLRTRPRPIKYPRPHSHLFFSPTTGRSLRGGRHTRRYENSLFLKTLFPLTEEEIEEDYQTIAPQHHTSFTQVLSDNHKQILWERFSKLGEEEQFDLLRKETVSTRKGKKIKKDKYYESLERITPQIRSLLLHDKRLPQGFIEDIEKELYEYFDDDPSSIIVYLGLTSYHRMLIHGICQYNHYTSETYHTDKSTAYIMVSCDTEEVSPIPPVPLYKLLQDKNRKTLY